jgi:hypothetical protein
MNGAKVEKLDDQNWICSGVTVKHKEGEAVHSETLHELFLEHQFDATIVLGTLHVNKLPPKSRDRRVLTTMLMLRKIQKMVYPATHSMQVVAENAMDTTSRKSFNPVSPQKNPDFVNVQGIYARVLVMALAYPLLYTAVSHLLYNSPRAPRLLLVNVGHEFIPFGKASFAQVVETLRRANPDDVAVGLLTEDGSMMICPAMRFVHEFGPGDKIILLTRRERRFGEMEEEAAASDGSFPTREPSPVPDSHRTTADNVVVDSFPSPAPPLAPPPRLRPTPRLASPPTP